MYIAYCAYLDLLGIGNLIRDATDLTSQRAAAARFEEVMEAGFGWIHKPTPFGGNQLQARTFTDNVFIFAPFERRGGDPENESLYWFIADQCASSQFELALKGQLVRGGLDVGFVQTSQTGVIGNGLIRAYEMEQAAVFPRILISPRMARVVSWHMSYYSSEWMPHNHELVWCADNQIMLNYLDRSRNYTEDGVPSEEVISQHQEMILSALGTKPIDRRVKEKYIWLGAYHDWYCQRYDLPTRLCTDTVGNKSKFMFGEIRNVLSAATYEEMEELRRSGAMYDLLECSLT